jgi:hypothetical protein
MEFELIAEMAFPDPEAIQERRFRYSRSSTCNRSAVN